MHCRPRPLLDHCAPLTVDLLCPFIYQTRSIVRRRSRICPTWSRGVTSTSNSTAIRRWKPDTDASSDSSPPLSFLKQKASQVASSPQSNRGSSMTPAEQAAFDDIMTLFERPGSSSKHSHATSTDQTATDYKDILDLFASLPRERHEAIDKTGSLRPPDQRTPDDDHPTLFWNTFQSRPRSHSKPEIQDPIKDDTATSTVSTTTSSAETSDQTFTGREDVTETAHQIAKDVVDSLTTALQSTNPRPDIAMWRVAEEKIFPLIQLLRPSPSSTSPSPPSSSSIANNRQQTVTDTSNDNSSDSSSSSSDGASSPPQPPPSLQKPHPLIPPTTPLLPLLAQLYPSLTLLLLRHYASHHPTSPYALALLPTLKSLGPTSYVLGVNTHFYNTLLSLQWTIYSDLREMNDLLTEMEAKGVEFDMGTWNVLRRVGEDRERDLGGGGGGGGAKGERGARWWDRMEQRLWWERIGVEWRAMVKRRVEEKGMSTGEVMREVGSGGGGKVGVERSSSIPVFTGEDDQSNGEYVVTL